MINVTIEPSLYSKHTLSHTQTHSHQIVFITNVFLWNFLPHVSSSQFQFNILNAPFHSNIQHLWLRDCRWWWWWWCYDIFVNKLIKKPQRKYPHTRTHTPNCKLHLSQWFCLCVQHSSTAAASSSSSACALCPVCKPQEHHIFQWKPIAANTLHSNAYTTSHPFVHKIAKQTRFFNSQNGFLFFIHILQLILVLQLFHSLVALGKCVCLYVCVRVCVCICKQRRCIHSVAGYEAHAMY